ncbi:MAG TPA: Cys-tRNA(Pro) deacylase [Azospirillaceae bacterium]|nr:Cys-tRNA(Pro) deacylase [Azospirillaceae bacterium]HRQ80685.1 Cys-tRNA(Pro) deacylase [Azospirillaceae bacterium]
MAKTTRATQALDRAKIAYEVFTYDYDAGAARIGEHAAACLGVPAAQVLKSLMMVVDGRAVCVLVPSDRQASLKRVAAAMKGKSAEMMRPADAERVTGYLVGGVSPFGQKRRHPALVDASAMAFDQVFLNGGGRGVQVRLSPKDLVAGLEALVAEITAE